MNYAAVRGIVRSMVGDHYTHRYRILNDVITQNTTEEKPLLLADDDPDYDIEPTATTPRECETGSKITGIDLTLNVAPTTVATTVEWLLWKNPDQVLNTITPGMIFENELTPTLALLRKYTLAYGYFRNTSSRESRAQHVRIGRAALGRASRMRENDLLLLSVRETSNVGTVSLSYFGRVWTLES